MRYLYALALLVVLASWPSAQLRAEQPPIVKLTEEGCVSAIRTGGTWVEVRSNLCILVKGWKKLLHFRKFAREKGPSEGRRVWAGLMKEEGGTGFKATQTVRREGDSVAFDISFTALGSDRNEETWCTYTLPMASFTGWRFKCDETEGTLPKTFKGKEVCSWHERASRLELSDTKGQRVIAFRFPEGASLCIYDGRDWKKSYYWLGIRLRSKPMEKGQSARLQMSVSSEMRAPSPNVHTTPAPVPEPTPAPAVKPQPVPNETFQKEAKELIHDFFRADFAKTTPAERALVAKKLMAEARLTNTDMELKYVLLQEACRVAMDGGHVSLALQALDTTGAAFVFDAAKEKAALLTRLAKTAKTPEAAQNVAETSLAIAENQVEKGEYEEVQAFLSLSQTTAKRVNDKDWSRNTQRRLARLQDILRDYSRAAPAFKNLKKDPEDPVSNGTAGTFLCFIRGQWAQGLKHLAKSNDAEVKRIATVELADPDDPTAQVQLGQEWWKYSKSLKESLRAGVQKHAIHWMQKGFAGVEGELRAQAAKTILAFYESTTGKAAGMAFEAGNVALVKNGAKLMRVTEGGTLSPESNSRMIDGVKTGYTGSTGYTYRSFPCAWVIVLPKKYLLQEIRMLLWDGEPRFYRYKLETSADGKAYELVKDCSKGEWRSWQTLSFAPRMVRHIRLKGLHNSANSGFHVVELEAYCAPPVEKATPKYPSKP